MEYEYEYRDEVNASERHRSAQHLFVCFCLRGSGERRLINLMSSSNTCRRTKLQYMKVLYYL